MIGLLIWFAAIAISIPTAKKEFVEFMEITKDIKERHPPGVFGSIHTNSEWWTRVALENMKKGVRESGANTSKTNQAGGGILSSSRESIRGAHSEIRKSTLEIYEKNSEKIRIIIPEGAVEKETIEKKLGANEINENEKSSHNQTANQDRETSGESMTAQEFCKKRKYPWTPEIERKYKFILRSAKIKNYSQKEVDQIIIDLLQKNKHILGKKRSERLKVALSAVEIVLKNQVKRKKKK